MKHVLNDQIKEKMFQANKYITTLLLHTGNKIPKSTTCCWRLSKDYDYLIMHQYFVSPQYMFGIDVSSKNLCNNNDVGDTFIPSLFYHCTTIPIWKDKKNGKINFEGPKDKYNFAWGSNGTSKETS